MEETSTFNAELMKMLCDDDEESEKECLITSLPLNDNCIQLVCKHTFNYEALFSEISRQKKFNKLETTKLKPREIKCPYCRTIQNGLIPPCKNLPELLEIGVNKPSRHIFKGNKCISLLKSGKRKGEQCNKGCYGKYCTLHEKKGIDSENDTFCTYILKRGKRKGQRCGCKCTKQDNIKNKKCSKHLN